MEGILGSVRALGLVAIVAVILQFCGVAEADNPCYAECFLDCTRNHKPCMFDPQCIATCGITCAQHDTCKHGSRKVLRNSAKVVAIQSNTIEKNTVGVEAGNPCYAECVQDCLNNCGLSPFGCAACPGICGLHNTCKDVKKVEIISGKPEDVAKSHFGVEAGNPCYAECVQDCLNNCGLSPFGCAACPGICGLHNTCKDVKKVEINSGKPEDVAKSHFGVEAGNPCYAECVQDCLNNRGLSPFGCAACPGICGLHNTCKDVKNIEINSGKPEDVVQSHFGVEAGNPCYAECVQDCLNNCGLSPFGCAACPGICGLHNTCKDIKNIEINSVKPEEAMAIQSKIIEENSVGVVEGNPCYAECIQDCLNTCSFVGCAACSAICGTHDTCKHEKNLQIQSVAKCEEGLAIQSDTVEENSVGVEGGNPCYAQCVQTCLNNCVLSPFGCAACPGICSLHNTCKDVKNVEINSGKPEDVAKNLVGVEARNTLLLNSVADE